MSQKPACRVQVQYLTKNGNLVEDEYNLIVHSGSTENQKSVITGPVVKVTGGSLYVVDSNKPKTIHTWSKPYHNEVYRDQDLIKPWSRTSFNILDVLFLTKTISDKERADSKDRLHRMRQEFEAKEASKEAEVQFLNLLHDGLLTAKQVRDLLEELENTGLHRTQ